jgi:uncharacterized protein YlxW (UPF0749 family)
MGCLDPVRWLWYNLVDDTIGGNMSYDYYESDVYYSDYAEDEIHRLRSELTQQRKDAEELRGEIQRLAMNRDDDMRVLQEALDTQNTDILKLVVTGMLHNYYGG